MADKKKKISKDVKYNKEKREALFRVEITSADTKKEAEEMRQMKNDIIEHSGTAKKGAVDMYRFCKENGFFKQL